MSQNAHHVLQTEFHVARAKILELAAFLDRLDRAEGVVENEKQLALIRSGIEILQEKESRRAERVQLLMSREYEPDWRTKLAVEGLT